MKVSKGEIEEVKKDVRMVFSAALSSMDYYLLQIILEISKNEQTDLIILPSPYAERVEKDNLDSLGATIEILNNRSTVPLLLLTESNIKPEKITDRLLLPVRQHRNRRNGVSPEST